MGNFAKKNGAKTKKRIGQAQMDDAKRKKGHAVLGKRTTKTRLAQAKEGAKNYLQGSMELNRLKRAQSSDSKN